ncbi:MAG TPA: hypothetical protein VJ276_04705 [Thermoanaerobaculia bacterium]|nr:hypothetical protein [Thermoanaerobaculia bacterium]
MEQIYQFLRTHAGVALLLEQLLAVIAIVFAFAHSRKLEKQLRRVDIVRDELDVVQSHLSQQVHHLSQIRGSLPTQHLGEFPNYLRHIVQLVDRADRRIIICCDFPAYGSFSNPEAFLEYRQALERRIGDGVPVRIACLGAAPREARTREQFLKTAAAWEEWKRKEVDKFETYLSFHSTQHDPASLQNEDFVKMIVAEDTNVLASTFAAAAKQDLETAPPIYFWLVDDSMVFVIPSPHRLMEHGFVTQDSHFIDGICDIARRYTQLFETSAST